MHNHARARLSKPLPASPPAHAFADRIAQTTPHKLELRFDCKAPEMSKVIHPLALNGRIDVQRVSPQPHQNLSYRLKIDRQTNGNHKIVERENAQEPPDIELARGEPGAYAGIVDRVAGAQQDPGDEKAAEYKEELDRK